MYFFFKIILDISLLKHKSMLKSRIHILNLEVIFINKKEERIHYGFTTFLLFSFVVILSVKHYPDDDFISMFLNFLALILFVNRFMSMLISINHTNYIKQVIQLQTNSRAELKQKVEPIRQAKLKSVKQIYLFTFLVYLPLFFGLEWAYNVNSKMIKPFVFTNFIFIYYLIDRKIQFEQGLQKKLIKDVY